MIFCHIDDLIITGPNQSLINNIIDEISKTVKLEKIGDIHQFLGMQICPDYQMKALKINQNKYTSVLLEKFSKNNLRPVSSPVELGINLEPLIWAVP
ncbi:Retrovirus-related Pol polyprotein from transposon TNT 1-94, partial [Erysiphe neolycopersici]